MSLANTAFTVERLFCRKGVCLYSLCLGTEFRCTRLCLSPPFSLSNLCPVHSRISLVTGSGGPIPGCGLWVFPLLVEQEFISVTRHQPCYLINSQVWHLCHLNQKKKTKIIKLKPVLLLAKKIRETNKMSLWFGCHSRFQCGFLYVVTLLLEPVVDVLGFVIPIEFTP